MIQARPGLGRFFVVLFFFFRLPNPAGPELVVEPGPGSGGPSGPVSESRSPAAAGRVCASPLPAGPGGQREETLPEPSSWVSVTARVRGPVCLSPLQSAVPGPVRQQSDSRVTAIPLRAPGTEQRSLFPPAHVWRGSSGAGEVPMSVLWWSGADRAQTNEASLIQGTELGQPFRLLVL